MERSSLWSWCTENEDFVLICCFCQFLKRSLKDYCVSVYCDAVKDVGVRGHSMVLLQLHKDAFLHIFLLTVKC